MIVDDSDHSIQDDDEDQYHVMSTDSNVIIMVNWKMMLNMIIELIVKLMVKPVMMLVLKVSLRS